MDGNKQQQIILQKEQKTSKILQKIQNEKTIEKNNYNGNGQTKTYNPKKHIESGKKLDNRLIDLLKVKK